VQQLSRSERRDHVLDRDGGRCVWCRREISKSLVRATTDHLVPRLKGGPSWLENELVACSRCNKRRGHASPAAWINVCRRNGWEPDEEVVVRALLALQDAIAQRGGQRRARAYVDSQLRRLLQK
jgi:5-methylcytosine-specific restriction endonuclease McrA